MTWGGDLAALMDLLIMGGIGGLWFRLGSVLQGQTDNRRRMSAIETQIEKFQTRLANLER